MKTIILIFASAVLSLSCISQNNLNNLAEIYSHEETKTWEFWTQDLNDNINYHSDSILGFLSFDFPDHRVDMKFAKKKLSEYTIHYYDKELLKEIKAQNPNWVSTDGSIISYYNNNNITISINNNKEVNNKEYLRTNILE